MQAALNRCHEILNRLTNNISPEQSSELHDVLTHASTLIRGLGINFHGERAERQSDYTQDKETPIQLEGEQ